LKTDTKLFARGSAMCIHDFHRTCNNISTRILKMGYDDFEIIDRRT